MASRDALGEPLPKLPWPAMLDGVDWLRLTLLAGRAIVISSAKIFEDHTTGAREETVRLCKLGVKRSHHVCGCCD